MTQREIIERVLEECACAGRLEILVENSRFFCSGRSIAKPNGLKTKKAVRGLYVAIGYTTFRSPFYIGVRMARSARDADGRSLEAVLRNCLGGQYADVDIWYGPDTEDHKPNFWPLYKNYEVPSEGASDKEIDDVVAQVCREFCDLIEALERCGSR